MSMKRAQEYFAPLRSRHISLQQWERGLLFESWGRRGGRADRRKSEDLDGYMMAISNSEEQEGRPIKKVIARSVSFSAFGMDNGSEVKANFFKRGLSFSRSLAPTGEIIPEDSEYHHPPVFRTKTSTGGLFSRSMENSRRPLGRSRSGVEISDGGSSSRSEYLADNSDRLQTDGETRPLPKKFFSGSLLFSKDRKFFSGTLSFTRNFGRSSSDLQVWDTKDNILSPYGKNRISSTDQEGRYKKNFFTRVLSFSRSLDPRGEISSEARDMRTPYNGTEMQASGKLFGRDLSFSRSLDPTGEISSEDSDNSPSFKGTEIEEPKDFFGRELSFSRSLDPDGSGDSISDTTEASDNSGVSSLSEFKAPELSRSKKFISRSGLFFSKSLDPRRYRENPPKICGTGRFSDESEKDPKEFRSRKLFGRGFSLNLSRFLDPIRNNSSMNPGTTSRPEKIDKEFQFKTLFMRGFFSSNSRTLDPKDHAAASTYLANGSSDSNKKSQSKRFFSRDWSWSRTKSTSSSAQLPVSFLNSTKFNSSAAVNNSHSSTKTGSRTLKYWWSRRSQSAAASAFSSTSGLGNDKTNRLVLLEKVPAADDQESDDMTVYVGERGESLTKYVLTKQILRHHLFQVLLKCSQDELGSDYDYNSGVPIICDPALFLQVARVVGGNCTAEAQLCRFVYVAKPTAEELLQCTLDLIKTQANYRLTKRADDDDCSTCDSDSSRVSISYVGS